MPEVPDPESLPEETGPQIAVFRRDGELRAAVFPGVRREDD